MAKKMITIPLVASAFISGGDAAAMTQKLERFADHLPEAEKCLVGLMLDRAAGSVPEDLRVEEYELPSIKDTTVMALASLSRPGEKTPHGWMMVLPMWLQNKPSQ